MPVPMDATALAALDCIRNAPKIDPSKFDEEAFERKSEEAQAVYDAEYKKWLSYYDGEGCLKPGARKDSGYMADMPYTLVNMTDDETAAFIAAEKKRLGVV